MARETVLLPKPSGFELLVVVGAIRKFGTLDVEKQSVKLESLAITTDWKQQ